MVLDPKIVAKYGSDKNPFKPKYNINPLKKWLIKHDVRIRPFADYVRVNSMRIEMYLSYGDQHKEVSAPILERISRATGMSVKYLRSWKSPKRYSAKVISSSKYYIEEQEEETLLDIHRRTNELFRDIKKGMRAK